MTLLLYIVGAAIIALLCWVVADFREKHQKWWRNLVIAAVFFGGLWLANEGKYETLRLMASLLPFTLVWAIVMTWQFLDQRPKA